jgi:hypothetical protein
LRAAGRVFRCNYVARFVILTVSPARENKVPSNCKTIFVIVEFGWEIMMKNSLVKSERRRASKRAVQMKKLRRQKCRAVRAPNRLVRAALNL